MGQFSSACKISFDIRHTYSNQLYTTEIAIIAFALWNSVDQPTSGGFRKAFVKMECDFVDEVLDVGALGTAYVDDPVVREAFLGGPTAQHCPVTELQSHLHRLSITTVITASPTQFC